MARWCRCGGAQGSTEPAGGGVALPGAAGSGAPHQPLPRRDRRPGGLAVWVGNAEVAFFDAGPQGR